MACAVLPSAFFVYFFVLAGQTACDVQCWRGDCMTCAVLPLPYLSYFGPGGGYANCLGFMFIYFLDYFCNQINVNKAVKSTSALVMAKPSLKRRPHSMACLLGDRISLG